MFRKTCSKKKKAELTAEEAAEQRERQLVLRRPPKPAPTSRFGRMMKRIHDQCRTPRDIYVTSNSNELTPAWCWALRRNETESRLHKLPDEILLAICKQSDKATLYALRQSCRLLMRITMDHHLPTSQLAHPWKEIIYNRFTGVPALPVYCPAYVGGPPNGPFTPCYLDQYCQDCRIFRKTGFSAAIKKFQTRIWCSRCKECHPALLFTAVQRATPDADRVCIGRQGRLRLCPHETMSWDEYQDKLERLRKGSSSKNITDTCKKCRHAFDLPQFHSSKDLIRLTSTIETFNLDPAVPITKQHIRNFLLSPPSQRSDLTDMLCPHVKHNKLQLMLPFEPDRCACFEATVQVPEKEYYGEHHLHHNHERELYTPCCRCLANKNPYWKGKFLPEETPAITNGDYVRSSHTFFCRQCDSCYEWVRRKGNLVYLLITCSVWQPSTPTCQNWLRNIDLDLLGICTDNELRGIMWCNNSNCATEVRWTKLINFEC